MERYASNPLSDLKSAQRLVSGACGFAADVIIMGKDAADAFEANPQVMEAYNKLFISQGSIDPKSTSWGVINLGVFRGVALTVDETTYENSAGQLVYYVPPTKVLIAASGLAGQMGYTRNRADERQRGILDDRRGAQSAARLAREGRRLSQAARERATRARAK